MTTTPSGGISALTSSGRVAVSSPAAKRRKRKEALAFQNSRVLGAPLPPGVEGREVRYVDVPIQNAGEENFIATYKSADGETYRFRTHTNKGKPVEGRELLCLFLGVREVSLGGTPREVFKAFDLTIKDLDGKAIYPAPEV